MCAVVFKSGAINFGRKQMKIKKNYYEPEMGQAIFGNPMGFYECPEFVGALLKYLLEEIERVYWNVNQKEWDKNEDPKIKGIEFNSYYWGDNEEEGEKPNFKFKSVEIRWYKYVGRGMSLNKEMSEKQWRQWFDKCLKVIRKADKK